MDITWYMIRQVSVYGGDKIISGQAVLYDMTQVATLCSECMTLDLEYEFHLLGPAFDELYSDCSLSPVSWFGAGTLPMLANDSCNLFCV